MATATALPMFDERERPPREKITACVHCGLCLDKCPTYRLLGTEMDSPRGRIYLIKAVSEGRLAMTPSFVEHMYLCLECRACETACPSGVEFGSLMELARAQIERHVPRPWWQRLLRWLVFDELFPYPWRMEQLCHLLRGYQRLGVQTLVRRLRLLALLPARLRRMEAMLPPVPKRPFTRSVPPWLPARPPRQHRVALFSGCVMNLFFPDVHEATVRVLQANGCEVWVAPQQVCCGALHVHAGEREQAKRLARRNILVFERQEVDAIINNAAGCGAHLKTYGELLADDPDFAERAHHFSAKVQDIAEFLARTPLRGPLAPLRQRVAYDDPCHLLHAQRIGEQPRRLLRQIPELELVPVTDADFCCGAAGIYNLTHPEVSQRLLEQKIAHLVAAKPDVVATGNVGCILQLQAGMQQAGLAIPVVHPVTLLARAYEAAGTG
ncbi:MAG: glycolate oxidase iron-sulfur subunit [Candidatus Tectimicrobiota bacterium]|nr:MAG: glycolate oxidase iron-sulfur subunit [Candidatus Tectomicrobia bacterium]